MQQNTQDCNTRPLKQDYHHCQGCQENMLVWLNPYLIYWYALFLTIGVKLFTPSTDQYKPDHYNLKYCADTVLVCLLESSGGPKLHQYRVDKLVVWGDTNA